jgi:hypothetical protein
MPRESQAFFDVVHFLRDIAKPGGGLQQAIIQRGGVSKIRCLAARNDPNVELGVDLTNGPDAPSFASRPSSPFAAQIDCLDAIHGVDRRVAQVLMAEVGADMKPFPSHQHLSSWAGTCPGNEESAGERTRRRITPGNRWLKKTLAQAASIVAGVSLVPPSTP